MKAIQITEFGGPEKMKLVDLPDPEPEPGQVLVDVARSGVNYADTHAIRDDYLAKQTLPLIPGGEISGRGPDGRRVAAILAGGGYAQRVAVPEAALVQVPDEVSDDQAAALLLQGLTALNLLRLSARLAEGESVVIHAAAGGTGSLAVQIAKRLGAGRVIGLASSERKRELVCRLGADAAVDSRAGDLTAAILEANEGKPVDVVLEMSGGAAFDASLAAVAPFGRLVSFGLASGQPNEVRNADLMRTSRAVVGFWLMHLFSRPGAIASGIAELLSLVASGELEVIVGGVYPLSDARRAHEDLSGRTTEGKLLLDPSR